MFTTTYCKRNFKTPTIYWKIGKVCKQQNKCMFGCLSLYQVFYKEEGVKRHEHYKYQKAADTKSYPHLFVQWSAHYHLI